MTTLHFQNVQDVTHSLYMVSRGIFWDGLPIAFLLAILLIYVSGQITGQAFEGLFRRLIIAIILMAAFPQVSSIIHSVGERLTVAYAGEETLRDLFNHIGDKAKDIKDSGVSNWIKLGETVLTIVTTLSFIILSAIQHFLAVLQVVIWNILHILAPVGLLACLFPSLSAIPRGIFMGLLEVALWKPMWVILARILLAVGFGEAPATPDRWLDTVIMNFAVAGLVASTPMLVHGFLTGGLSAVGGSTLQTMASGMGSFMLQYPMSYMKTPWMDAKNSLKNFRKNQIYRPAMRGAKNRISSAMGRNEKGRKS